MTKERIAQLREYGTLLTQLKTDTGPVVCELVDALESLQRENAEQQELLLLQAKENAELRKDKERLSWVITQGPPGASQIDWLSEDAWELATCQVEDDSHDQECMRKAIDAARNAGG